MTFPLGDHYDYQSYFKIGWFFFFFRVFVDFTFDSIHKIKKRKKKNLANMKPLGPHARSVTLTYLTHQMTMNAPRTSVDAIKFARTQMVPSVAAVIWGFSWIAMAKHAGVGCTFFHVYNIIIIVIKLQ